MAIISSITARWILDSRGLPTIHCTTEIEHNGDTFTGTASVPSGASTGTHEALELRDNEDHFHGKGVERAVFNVNTTISEQLVDRSFDSAIEADTTMLSLDDSQNKSKLGANAILAVSMATHRAFASLNDLELWQYLKRLYFFDRPGTPVFPKLMCNVLNGGEHANNGLSIQEFMIVPATGNVEDDIRASSEIYHTLKKSLSEDNYSTALGDEGGFAPTLKSQDGINPTQTALTYLQQAIKTSGYSDNCQLAMDVAASEFYNSESESYELDEQSLSRANLAAVYSQLIEDYDIISIEDGFGEDDVLGWEIMTESLSDKIKLIGDDLFVTNPQRFKDVGLENKIANGVLIKLNQIGSVKETCEMINLARQHGYVTAVSHRSGETTDDFISDLAFGAQSEFLKLGAPARGERVAKYNRLLQIKSLLS